MIAVLLLIFAFVICATLNKLRGAGFGYLRWVLAAVCGGLSYLVVPHLWQAVATAVGVMVFMVQPWGRWYLFLRDKRGWSGPPDRYEQALEKFFDRFEWRDGSTEIAAWTTSATLFSIPLAGLTLNPFYLGLGPLIVATYIVFRVWYEINPLPYPFKSGMPLTEANAVRWSELVFGGFLGFFVVIAS